MISLVKNILCKYARFQISKNSMLSICRSANIDYSRVSLKNHKHCRLTVGDKSMISASLIFEKDGSSIEVGNNTFLGGCTLSCADAIRIGNNVQIAWGVTIFDHNSHSLDFVERRNDLNHAFSGKKTWNDVKISPTVIQDDVWIGVNAIILKGVTVARGAIIGAGSVVTKDVQEYSLYAGNPAVFVRKV